MSGFEMDAFDGGWDDFADAEIDDVAWVSCPYCGQAVALRVDPSGGAFQAYVEDCEVCCRPWSVRVAVGASGHPEVAVTTLDDA
jgi:hypothetical protein